MLGQAVNRVLLGGDDTSEYVERRISLSPSIRSKYDHPNEWLDSVSATRTPSGAYRTPPPAQLGGQGSLVALVPTMLELLPAASVTVTFTAIVPAESALASMQLTFT